MGSGGARSAARWTRDILIVPAVLAIALATVVGWLVLALCLLGLVDAGDAVRVDLLGAAEEVVDGERDLHGVIIADSASRIHKGPGGTLGRDMSDHSRPPRGRGHGPGAGCCRCRARWCA